MSSGSPQWSKSGAANSGCTGNPISHISPVTEASNEVSFVLDMATSNDALGKISFKCVYMLYVSCTRPMLLSGHGEEEREHHPTRIRGGLLWKCGCMCYVCVCHAPQICCQGVY